MKKGENKHMNLGPFSNFISIFYIEHILGLLFMNLNKVNDKKKNINSHRKFYIIFV